MANEEKVVRLIRSIAGSSLQTPAQVDLARELIRLIKGTCTRDDCEKYDEAALDNCGQPGVCIYHKAETEPGIRIPMEPCNELCDNGECMNNGEGNKCQNYGICEDHTPVEQPSGRSTTLGPCNEPCTKDDCNGSVEGVCKAWRVCSLRMILAPMGYCKAEETGCSAYNPKDKSCNNTFIDGCTFVKADELQGYTLDQWEQIRAGGYLCQFSDVGDKWLPFCVALADASNAGFNRFNDDTGQSWAYCRPAELPGVLRPWFGGDCPIADPRPEVFFKDRIGRASILRAGDLTWTWSGNNLPSDIIAFMEVK